MCSRLIQFWALKNTEETRLCHTNARLKRERNDMPTTFRIALFTRRHLSLKWSINKHTWTSCPSHLVVIDRERLSTFCETICLLLPCLARCFTHQSFASLKRKGWWSNSDIFVLQWCRACFAKSQKVYSQVVIIASCNPILLSLRHDTRHKNAL